MGLRGVLQNPQITFRRDFPDPADVRRLPVEMHGKDSPGVLGDGGFDFFRIDVVGALVRLHGHGPRADIADREPRGNVRVARDDYLVSRSDPKRFQRKDQGFQAVAHADAVLRPGIFREFTLEGLEFLAQQVVAAVQDAGDGLVDLLAEFARGRLQVQKRNVTFDFGRL